MRIWWFFKQQSKLFYIVSSLEKNKHFCEIYIHIFFSILSKHGRHVGCSPVPLSLFLPARIYSRDNCWRKDWEAESLQRHLRPSLLPCHQCAHSPRWIQCTQTPPVLGVNPIWYEGSARWEDALMRHGGSFYVFFAAYTHFQYWKLLKEKTLRAFYLETNRQGESVQLKQPLSCEDFKHLYRFPGSKPRHG